MKNLFDSLCRAARLSALAGLSLLPAINSSIAQEATSVAEAAAQQSLFNGVDLTGWKGDPKLWSVEDGAITGKTTADAPLDFNRFLIWDAGQVSDFVLEFDYRLRPADEQNPGGNSGVQYRSRVLDEENFVVGGYQADIDHSLRYSGINYEEKGRGILAERGQRVTIQTDGSKEVEQFASADELQKQLKAGEWNHYKIVADGVRVSHYINGELMSEVIDHEVEKAAAEGVLALQIHTGPPMIIQFKNITLAETK